MTFSQMQELARNLGIKEHGSHTSQTQLIRNIQAMRGDESCYSTDKRYTCKEQECEWRRDCVKLRAVWLR
ncbi:MAG TPA: hypothetical protein VFW53_10680 [Gallionella sp.]|nr:hypothetical protein [Gallionella sp.]